MRDFGLVLRGILGARGAAGLALAACSVGVASAAQAQSGRVTPRVLEQLRANPASAKSILVANKIEWCGTVASYYKNNPEARMAMQEGKACRVEGQPDLPGVRNAAIPSASTAFKTVRIAVHYFTNDDGSAPTSSQAQVDGAVKQLNIDYAASRIRFVSTGTYVHRSTKFREPKTNDDGLGDVVKEMKRTYAIDPARQLNVYVFEAATANPQLLGEGTFPWDAAALASTGGFYCDNDAFGLGKFTATHEFGHCLGLYHPFRGFEEVEEDGCSGCREVAGRTAAEGDVTGDFCSDTPATPKSFVCGSPAADPSIPQAGPCNRKPWGTTDFRNFMGYADDDCINHFTPQQNGRMHAWVDAKLKSWLVPDAPSALPTVTATAPTGRVLSSVPEVSATFSVAMDKASVQGAFSLTASGSSASNAGAFTWAADAKSFVFKPSAPLSSGAVYTARVLGTAKGASGAALDGNRNGKADGSAADAVSWSFTIAGGPANDAFARAQVLAGATGRVAGTTLEASKERGEPNHGGDRGGASIWYRWTAPAAGNVTFSTVSTRFDTLLGAYSGSSVSALRTLAGNNNASVSTGTSTVRFAVSAGQVVYVAIDGARDSSSLLPATGPTHLFWSFLVPPSNDSSASATLISGAAGSVRGTNVGATVEAGEASPLGEGASPVASVWYLWKAPSSGAFSFNLDTEVRPWRTLVAVYEVTASGRSLVAVGRPNDLATSRVTTDSATVRINAVSGKEYLVLVDGAPAGTAAPSTPQHGIFRLRWAPVPSQPRA